MAFQGIHVHLKNHHTSTNYKPRGKSPTGTSKMVGTDMKGAGENFVVNKDNMEDLKERCKTIHPAKKRYEEWCARNLAPGLGLEPKGSLFVWEQCFQWNAMTVERFRTPGERPHPSWKLAGLFSRARSGPIHLKERHDYELPGNLLGIAGVFNSGKHFDPRAGAV
jgi:hypothetical protein